VDDAALVGGGEAAGDLEGPGHGLAQRRDPASQGLAKGLALEEFEDEVGVPVVGADFEDGDDVGVGELGGGSGLDLEAAQSMGRRCPVGGDELDGDLAGQTGIPDPVHLAHASRAEGRQDLVGTESRAFSQHS